MTESFEGSAEGTVPESVHPRPQLVRPDWTDLCGDWGFAYDDDDVGLTERWQQRQAVRPDDHRAVPAGVARVAASATPAFHPVVWYRPDRGRDRRRRGRAAAAALRRGRLPAPRSGSTAQLVGDATRAGTRRSRSTSPTRCARRRADEQVVVGPRRGPADRRDPAARQAGLADRRRTRSGTTARPASGSRCGSSRCRRRTSPTCLDAGRRPGGVRVEVRLEHGAPGPPTGRPAPVGSASEALADAAVPRRRRPRPSPDVAHARTAQRPGASRLLWSPEHAHSGRRRASSSHDGAGRRAVDARRQLPRAARRRTSATAGSCSTGSPTTCGSVLEQGYWPESHLAAPDRGGAAARGGADQGARLQRRAHAPEGRGPALPVLVRPARACSSGARWPTPTSSAATAVERLTREWLEVVAPRPQPSVDRHLGADQRELGRASTSPTQPAQQRFSSRCTT